MKRLLAPACLLILAGCSDRQGETFYLFRNSIAVGERVHVATFDAREGRSYNEENCILVRDLIQNQPDVRVVYWCTEEKP